MSSSIQVPPLSWKSVDNKANEALSVLAPECLERPMATPIVNILEFLLPKYFNVHFGVSNLPQGIEAQFNPITNEIILQESVYEDLHRGDPRAFFTIAHEIGHVILHANFLKEINSGERQAILINRGESKAYLDPEKQANRFAAEFLMPSSMVIKRIKEGSASVADMMNTFEVSCSVASIKLRSLSKNLGL